MNSSVTKICIERIEQILMSVGYVYNRVYRLFERVVGSNVVTVYLDTKKSLRPYMLVDTRVGVDGVGRVPDRILINYFGRIPSTEIDFLILMELLCLDGVDNFTDSVYFRGVVIKLRDYLNSFGFVYSGSNNKYFKRVSFDKQIYLCIVINLTQDRLHIFEEYTKYSLIKSVNDNSSDHDNTLTIYHGSIPKTGFELQTLIGLIDLIKF